MRIERLDPRNQADVDAVADLHLAQLSASVEVQLGQRFLRRFYYQNLVEDGLIDCWLCRAEGNVVGFISSSRYPRDFVPRGVRGHLPRLIQLLLASALERPALVKDIVRILGVLRDRGRRYRTDPSPGLGEVLSLVVLPRFQRYVPVGGQSRATARLFETMVADFRAAGFERVHLLVQPTNRASNIFCSSMGCQFEKIKVVDQLVYRYTYMLNGQPSEAPAEA